ncbi:MAG: flagellar hook-basal body complex protein FliE [Mariprofundaceae bacterium]
MNIGGIGAYKLQAKTESMPSDAKSGEFGSVIKQYMQDVNSDGKAAAKASESLALGHSNNVAETLLAVQKADLSFQMMLGVRNKLVDAYREVMRMSV